MSFKEIQKEKTAQIEQILKAYLPRVEGTPPNADAGDIPDVWRNGQGD